METLGFAAVLRRPRWSPRSAAGPCCRSAPAGGAAGRGPVAEVVVVGGGVGGLAAAIRLRAAGHGVTILERRAELGREAGTSSSGRASASTPDRRCSPCRRSSTSCSGVAGTSLADAVPTAPAGPAAPSPVARRIGLRHARRSRGDGRRHGAVSARAPARRYRRFEARGARIWEVGRRTFLAGPMTRRLGARCAACARPADLRRDRSAAHAGRRRRGAAFTDPRLVQWAGRYATYSGSSPYAGAGHAGLHPVHRGPAKGSGTRPAAWARCGTRSSRVAIDRRGGRSAPGPRSARSRLAGGRGRAVCARPTGDGTAPTSWSPTSTPSTSTATCCRTAALLARATRAGRSLSGFVVLAGVRGHDARHAATTPSGSPPTRRPSSASSLTRRVRRRPDHLRLRLVGQPTPARRQPGHENWFLLVNAPARAADRPRGLPRPRAGAAGRARHRPARPGSCFTECAHAGRPGRPLPQPGRGDLRDVVERAPGRVPAPRQPRAAAAACTWSAGPAIPEVGCRSWRSSAAHRRRPRRARTAGERSARLSRSAGEAGAALAVAAGLRRPGGGAAWRGPLTVGVRPRSSTDHRCRRNHLRRHPGAGRGGTHRRPSCEALRRRPDRDRGDRRGRRVHATAPPRSPASSGATVITGAPLPPGWVGKPWALDQGLRAAARRLGRHHGRRRRAGARAGRGRSSSGRTADGLDLVSVAGRFACPTPRAALAPPRAC